MSSLLANRRVDLVALDIPLGRHVMKPNTSKYAHLDPDYLRSIVDGIGDIAAELVRKVGATFQEVPASRIEHK